MGSNLGRRRSAKRRQSCSEVSYRLFLGVDHRSQRWSGNRITGVRNCCGRRAGKVKIPFPKAHGAHNDFLLTWRRDAPEPESTDYAAIARAICERHTGIGADGWMLVDPAVDADAEGAIE